MKNLKVNQKEETINFDSGKFDSAQLNQFNFTQITKSVEQYYQYYM